jgi:hypothetical protein
VNRLSGIALLVCATRDLRAVALAVALFTAACGSGERRPDTGAGANAPVPITINCQDFCARLADCVVILCNEDTKAVNDTSAKAAVETTCLSNCMDADAQKLIPPSAWSCVFQSSCRMAFDYDDCHGFSTYTCH